MRFMTSHTPILEAPISLEAHRAQTQPVDGLEAFVKKMNQSSNQGSFAKELANTFLRTTQQQDIGQESSSSSKLLELNAQYNQLVDEASAFLEAHTPLIADSAALDGVLLEFASYRLSQSSRAYYFAGLRGEDTSRYVAQIRNHQQAFDNIMMGLGQ